MKQSGKGKIIAAAFPQFFKIFTPWYYLCGFDHYVERKNRDASLCQLVSA